MNSWSTGVRSIIEGFGGGRRSESEWGGSGLRDSDKNRPIFSWKLTNVKPYKIMLRNLNFLLFPQPGSNSRQALYRLGCHLPGPWFSDMSHS